MKQTVEKRKPSGFVDYIALALTTWGVGYGPVAPGTWGSAVGVLIYLGVETVVSTAPNILNLGLGINVFILVSFLLFCFVGIWAASRSIPLLGNSDPPQAVVDEVLGQLTVFLFVPFGIGWPLVLAGFLLFRLFDIWKPYPIRTLEILPGGLGICADDIVAGVYAGICLAVGYAVTLLI